MRSSRPRRDEKNHCPCLEAIVDGTLFHVYALVYCFELPFLGEMLSLIVVGKFLVWMAVVRLFRYPLRTAIAVAAGLTQIGELSFVVVQVGRSSGLVDEGIFSAVVAASLFSILMNVFVSAGRVSLG